MRVLANRLRHQSEPLRVHRAWGLAPGVLIMLLIGAGAFGLQAATLPRPAQAEVHAVDVLRWLGDRRVVQTTERLGDTHAVETVCLQERSRPGAATLLLRGWGILFVDRYGSDWQGVKPSPPPREMRQRLALAACPERLAEALAAQLASAARRVGNESARTSRLVWLPVRGAGKLGLVIERRSLTLELQAGEERGSSRVRAVRPRMTVLQKLRIAQQRHSEEERRELLPLDRRIGRAL